MSVLSFPYGSGLLGVPDFSPIKFFSCYVDYHFIFLNQTSVLFAEGKTIFDYIMGGFAICVLKGNGNHKTQIN